MRKQIVFFLLLLSFLVPPCHAVELLTVTRVIDGDTLQLSNGETVMLIGVDTPESSQNFKLWRDARRTGQDIKEITQMGEVAAEFTRKLVEGKPVRIEYDVEKKDKYGKALAYVFVDVGWKKNAYLLAKYPKEFHYANFEDEDKDYLFLNATVIGSGYSPAMAVPPNMKYQELFLRAEKEAQEEKRGFWGDGIEGDPQKLGYRFGIEDATGRGNVRTSNAKVGVDYQVSPNASVGVEASQGLHDTQDAAAWGSSVDDETAAQAKYKLSF